MHKITLHVGNCGLLLFSWKWMPIYLDLEIILQYFLMLMMIFFRFTPLINQVIRFRFWCNFFIVQFYIIKYNFQLDCWIELIFLQELLDMLLYIGLKVQVNRSLVRDYFKWSNSLDESCQICMSRPLSIVRIISRAKKRIPLRFQLDWKIDIHTFPQIYLRSANSPK